MASKRTRALGASNRRRIGSSGEELSNLGEHIESVADQFNLPAEKVEEMLRSTNKLPRNISKAFGTIQRDLLKKTREMERQLRKNNGASAEEVEMTKRKISASKGQIRDLDRVVESERTHLTLIEKLKRGTGGLTERIYQLKASYGVLGKILDEIWDAGKKLYDVWFELQVQTQKAMSSIQMASGASEAQLASFGDTMQGLRPVFASLTDDITGVSGASQFVQDLSTGMRGLRGEINELAVPLLAYSRGLGLGTEGSELLFRTITTGVDNPRKAFIDFQADLQRFADTIDVSAGVLAKDFLESRDAVAAFGRDGVNTFRRTATMASRFGFEAKKIFEIAKRFDTFGAATDNVNQLNAVLGTSISSFELMMEQDPARRVEMLRDAVRETGMQWDDMSRIQRQALAQSLGLGEEEASRLFKNNETLEDIEREQQRRQREQERNDARRISNEQMMNELLGRTKEWVDSISRAWNEIVLKISEALLPMLGASNSSFTDLIRKAGDFVVKLIKSEKFKQIVESAKKIVKDITEYIKNIDWDKVIKGAMDLWTAMKGAWDVALGFWDALKGAGRWFTETGASMERFFSGGFMGGLMSGLERAGQVMGPGGIIARGASWILERVREIVGLWGRVSRFFGGGAPDANDIVSQVNSRIQQGRQAGNAKQSFDDRIASLAASERAAGRSGQEMRNNVIRAINWDNSGVSDDQREAYVNRIISSGTATIDPQKSGATATVTEGVPSATATEVIERAPITEGTRSAADAGQMVIHVSINAADIRLDSSVIGRALYEASVRTSRG